jgi:hypothetical protein
MEWQLPTSSPDAVGHAYSFFSVEHLGGEKDELLFAVHFASDTPEQDYALIRRGRIVGTKQKYVISLAPPGTCANACVPGERLGEYRLTDTSIEICLTSSGTVRSAVGVGADGRRRGVFTEAQLAEFVSRRTKGEYATRDYGEVDASLCSWDATCQPRCGPLNRKPQEPKPAEAD